MQVGGGGLFVHDSLLEVNEYFVKAKGVVPDRRARYRRGGPDRQARYRRGDT